MNWRETVVCLTDFPVNTSIGNNATNIKILELFVICTKISVGKIYFKINHKKDNRLYLFTFVYEFQMDFKFSLNELCN